MIFTSARVTIVGFMGFVADCVASEAQEFQRPMDSVITNRSVMTFAGFENVARDQCVTLSPPPMRAL